MSLNEEPRDAHAEEFVDHNPLGIVRLKFFLGTFGQEAGDNGSDREKRNEEKKRRIKSTNSVKKGQGR